MKRFSYILSCAALASGLWLLMGCDQESPSESDATPPPSDTAKISLDPSTLPAAIAPTDPLYVYLFRENGTFYSLTTGTVASTRVRFPGGGRSYYGITLNQALTWDQTSNSIIAQQSLSTDAQKKINGAFPFVEHSNPDLAAVWSLTAPIPYLDAVLATPVILPRLEAKLQVVLKSRWGTASKGYLASTPSATGMNLACQGVGPMIPTIGSEASFTGSPPYTLSVRFFPSGQGTTETQRTFYICLYTNGVWMQYPVLTTTLFQRGYTYTFVSPDAFDVPFVPTIQENWTTGLPIVIP